MTASPLFNPPHLSVTQENDVIQVFLRECTVELNVGIYPAERTKPQPVIISIEVEAALPHHYQDPNESKLDRVINYERFYDFICNELPRLGHIPLLESVAEQIINFCFAEPRIYKVRVRLEKPEIFPRIAGAGIEISRVRRTK